MDHVNKRPFAIIKSRTLQGRRTDACSHDP